MVWFGRSSAADDDYDPVAQAPDPMGRTPDEQIEARQAMQTLVQAVAGLPARQSEGSVKTHYSRAVHALRDVLGEHWQ